MKVISVEDELTKPDPSVEAPKAKVSKINQEIKSKQENSKPHTQKLIDSLVKYGERKIGDETINSEGVKYRYDTVKYKNKTVPNWLNVLFERASKELTGKSFFSQFKYEKSPEKEYTFYISRPSSKGLPNEDASFSELVILDNVNEKYSKPTEPKTTNSTSSIDNAIESLRLSLEFLPSAQKEKTQIALEALEISKEFL